MMRSLLITISFLFVATLSIAQTAVAGKVTDTELKEGIFGANLVFYKDGNFITGASTDIDGNYKVNVDPGTYDVKVSYVGFNDKEIRGVYVKAGQTTNLDVEFGGDEGLTLGEVVVTEYKVPLIDKDNTTSGGTITSKEIRNLPTKNISALASTTAGLSQADEGGSVSVKGSRPDATIYFIDGMRVRGSLIPESEIEQLQVITGGMAAKYGDVTGGIISITTKGPSSNYAGSVELETSEYLDDFGYNLISANATGPILKKDMGNGIERSILGFRVSGRYRYQKDDDPPATPIYRVKDEVLARLQENPLLPNNRAAAENLTNDDVDVLGYNPNEEASRLDITAKLDAQLTSNIDVSLTGAFANSSNKFTPSAPSGRQGYWTLLNSHNNPTSESSTYRGNFRFRHRLGRQDVENESNKSLIQNAFYTLQVGYERTEGNVEDSRHGDDFFNYGYVGKFFYDYLPVVGVYDGELANVGVRSIQPGDDNRYAHLDYARTYTGYEGNETINPVIQRYNQNGVEGLVNSYPARNGFFGFGSSTSTWDQMFANVGQVYNSNQKSESDVYTFNASSSFDLVPGSSNNSRHSIEFGFLYEQRYTRGYNVLPRRLWVLADQLANAHILGVNFENSIGTVDFDNAVTSINPNDLEGEVPLYDLDIDENISSVFYKNIREAAGVPINEYINIQELDPSLFSLDMFNARSLIDARDGSSRLLDYWGYDYLGNKLSNSITFDDFFTAKDAEGNRTFPVPSFQPNYFAAYVQDKFTFNEITFRLGVRVDRYDANTKVLKDPYSLYDVMTAGDFFEGSEKPGAVGDDYKVYLTGRDSNTPIGYRKGDQWYDEEGTAVTNASQIFGTDGIVYPKLINEEADIQSENFNTSDSFEDYEPQLNIMPRLAFSFPISDEANFFAHYDVLVQRPPSGSLATALDYFYFQFSPPSSNPNLKPEKTIDYEVGFRQKVSNTSAVKVAIYYKELRDMIQVRTLRYVADVNSYQTFDNLDFGTVKGFTFQYDMRRTGNISANINYTLQFANGTGSSATSNANLNRRSNLRVLIPLNFDERHRLNGVIDYRYGNGKGPRMFGKNPLENFGVNLQAIAVSGRPYTARTTPQQFGSSQIKGNINGARLPWNFTLNLRVDKSFTISKSEKFPLAANVYLRVSNLLNAENVLGLYSANNSPDNDGFLASLPGKEVLKEREQSGENVEGFITSYQWAMTNPNFYSLPRRIYLGAIFDF